MKIKICKVCNKELEQVTKKQIYCSKYCNNKMFRLKNPNYNKTYKKKYYKKNSKKILDSKKQYELNNKEKVQQWNRNKYQRHKKYYKYKANKYHKENKEERIKLMKDYYEDNKETIIKNNTKYRTHKRRTDIKIRLIDNLRRRIHHFLKGNNKSFKTREILGCTLDEFKIHLEKQFDEHMCWENYGTYFNLDHIKPISLATNEQELIELNHYTNFRPLEIKENIRKSNKFDLN